MNRFYYILLLLTVVFVQKSAAQKHLQDSLLEVLKRHPAQDDKHLKALNELAAAQLWMINAESMKSAEEAIILAKKLDNREELARAYNNKASCSTTNNLEEAASAAQNALELYSAIKNKTGQFDSYTLLAAIYYNKGDLDKNKFYVSKALNLEPQISDPLAKGKLFMNLGSFYRNNNLDSALFCYRKANQYFEEAGHTDFVAYNFLFMGNTFNLFSINDSAIIYLDRSIELAKKTGSLCNLSNAYGVQGILYASVANHPKALDSFIKLLKIGEQRNDRFEQALACQYIGNIYCLMKNYSEAIKYNLKALKLAEGLNNVELLYSSYEVSGDIYFAQQKFTEALNAYKKGLEIADSTKIDFYIATMQGHVGNAYEKLNQFTMALNSFQKAIEINRKSSNNFLLTRNYISVATTIKNAPDPVLLEVGINPRLRNRIMADYYQEALLLNGESGELEVQRDALFGLSELYASQHEFGNALKYYKQYAIIKDSIVNTENSKNLANLQLQFDSEKQEQQIVSLQKDKALHQTEILKQKTQRNVLMGGCMLAFLFIVILINGYVSKSKIGKKLEQTVVHLQTSQQQLIEQGKLAALGKMTADVALQIKEPIGLIKDLSPEGAALVSQYEFADTEIERSAILEKLKMDLSEIHRNGKRANDVVKDVLSQSRRNSG